MSRPLDALRRFVRHEGGATVIEYGLIAALLSIVVIGAVTTTGTSLYAIMTNLSAKIAGH